MEDSTEGVLSSRWRCDVSCLDIDLSRRTSFGSIIHLQPHIGFRAGWMKQSLSLMADVSSTTSTFNLNTKFREKFTGYGMEGGLWIEFCPCFGLSLIGHIGGSLLYSEILLNRSFSHHNTSNSAGSPTGTDTEDQLHLGTPTVDYFVGLQYTFRFSKISLSTIVAWEQHVIYQINKFAASKENLTLGGLTLGFNIGF